MPTGKLTSRSTLDHDALTAAIQSALSATGARSSRLSIRKALEREGKLVSDDRLALALGRMVEAGILINVTWGAARGYELAKWESLAQAKEGSKSCEADILAMLAEVGCPLDGLAVFIALRERRRPWPEAAVIEALDRLKKSGELIFIPDGGRYSFPQRNHADG